MCEVGRLSESSQMMVSCSSIPETSSSSSQWTEGYGETEANWFGNIDECEKKVWKGEWASK